MLVCGAVSQYRLIFLRLWCLWCLHSVDLATAVAAVALLLLARLVSSGGNKNSHPLVKLKLK